MQLLEGAAWWVMTSPRTEAAPVSVPYTQTRQSETPYSCLGSYCQTGLMFVNWMSDVGLDCSPDDASMTASALYDSVYIYTCGPV